MAQRFFQRVIIGETFSLSARFPGEDLGDALLRVEVGNGLPSASFVLTKPDSDTALIENDATSSWSPGLYSLDLWFDWQSSGLNEVALEIRLSVEAGA